MHCFRVFWRFTIVLKWLGPPRLGQLFRAVAATRIPVAPRAVPPDCAGFQLWDESLGPDRDNASQMTLALEHRENWIPKNYHPKRETVLKDVNYRDPYEHTKKGQLSFPRVGLSTLCWICVPTTKGVVEGLCEWLKELQRSCEQWELLGMDLTRVGSYRRPG